MANEFKIKNGFLSTGDSQVTGSLTVSNGITGSLFGTASNAINAVSASYVSGSIVAPGSDTQITYNNNGTLFATSSFVYSGSNVGIGTPSPLYPLHITRNSSNNYIQLSGDQNKGLFAGNGLINFDTLGNFNIYTGGVNLRATFTSVGDLVLGTSTALSRLHVRGSGTTSATTGLRVENANASASMVVLDNGNVGVGLTSPTSLLHISGASASNLMQISSPTSANIIFVSGSGRVGIGTSSPIETFDVNGTSRFRNNITINQGIIGQVYTYNSFTDTNKINLSVERYHDHTDGAVDQGITSRMGWYKRQTSNISLARSIHLPIQFTAGASGVVGQFRSIFTEFIIGEGSTVSTPFVAHYISATKGTTGTVTSFTGIEIVDNSVSNTIYGFRSQLTSGSGKFGLYFDGTANNYLNGNVGLGTPTPSSSLHISGASSAALFEIDSPAVNNILFVSGSGRVGIGTGTPAYTLDVNGTVNLNSNNNVGSFRRQTYGNALDFTTGNGRGRISGHFTAGAQNADVAYLNVGYNRTSIISGSADGVNKRISEIALYGVDTSEANTYIAFNLGQNTPVEKFRFTFNGNLLIGNTTDLARLHVRGSGATSATTGLRVENANASASLIVNDAGDVYNNGAGGVTTNTFYGENVGRSASGAENSFFGRSAGQSNTTGAENSFFGRSAGQSNTTGASNCFFGRFSGLSNSIGTQNSFFGTNSGLNHASGTNNSFFGLNCGLNINSGNSNTFIGALSGRLISAGTSLTTANNSVFLGYDTRANSNSETNQIVIGHQAIGLGSNTSVIGNTSTTLFRPYGNVAIGKNTANAALDVSGSATITGSLNSILSTSNNIGFQQSESLRYSMGTQFVAGNYVALNNTSSVAHSVYSSSLSDLRIGVSAGTSSIPSLGANIPSQIVGFSLETGSNYSSIFAQRLDLSALGSGPANQAGILSVFGNNEQYELRTSSTDKSLNIRKYDTAGKYMQLSLKSASTGFEITNNLTSPSASLFSVFDNSGNTLLDIQQSNISLKPINIESTSDTIDFSVVGSSNGSGFILPLTQPPSPQPGSMYIDLAGPELKVWDGVAWLGFKPV